MVPIRNRSWLPRRVPRGSRTTIAVLRAKMIYHVFVLSLACVLCCKVYRCRDNVHKVTDNAIRRIFSNSADVHHRRTVRNRQDRSSEDKGQCRERETSRFDTGPPVGRPKFRKRQRYTTSCGEYYSSASYHRITDITYYFAK